MNSQSQFLQTAHLLLGLTRKEFEKRLSAGLIDPQILKLQLEQNSQETQLSTLCEKWIEMQSLEQVDQHSRLE